jgi:hypothetical protein
MTAKLCVFCVALSVIAGYGADFNLGTRGMLSVTVPEDWSVNGKPANRPDGIAVGYAFAFKPRSGANAKCLLTFAYITNRVPDKEVIRKEVLRITKQFVSGSVEKKQNVKDFALKQGHGAYCLFTDASMVGKKAPPGDYKVMGSGQVQLSDDVIGVVSLFADDPEGEEMKTMIKIIDSLKVERKKAR